MPNKRKCKHCGEYTREFTVLPVGAFCNRSHAILFAQSSKQQDKVKKARKLQEKRDLNERKKAARNKSWYVKKAQEAFNAYIRERDKDEPCISCGKFGLENKHGGAWDCGHFKSIGAFPELRYEPLNAHKQCKSCNSGSGKFGKFHKKELTVSAEYRERLIKKIGPDNVNWLEGKHEAKHYTKEQLEEIKKH